MQRLTVSTLTVLAALAVLAGSPAIAGHDYDIEVTDHKRERVEVTQLQVEGLNFKMGMASQGRRNPGGAMLFQGDRREGKEPRMIIEDGQGGHMIINQAKIEQLAKMIPPGATPMMNEQMMESIRAQAERIADPQARARALEQIEQQYGAMGGGAKPKLRYVERGIREKFGYPCVRYDVFRGDEKIYELWVTDWANIEGGRQTSKAFAEFEKFYTAMMETLSKASGMGDRMFGGDDNPFQKIFELDRFPVATYQYEGGEVVTTSVLKAARKVDHEPGTFKVDPNSVEREFGGR